MEAKSKLDRPIDAIDRRDTIRVYDVYHQRHFVSGVELARGKRVLRLFNSRGERIEGIIARENLAAHQAENLQSVLRLAYGLICELEPVVLGESCDAHRHREQRAIIRRDCGLEGGAA